MSYAFHGFFAQAGQDILEQALYQWPWLQGRFITEPFRGIGVGYPDVYAICDTDEEYWQAQEEIARVEQELPEWSRNFPDIVFVYIEAECFGGNCIYEGYICQNGEVTARETGKTALARLVGQLGVHLDQREYFAPFTRGFFDRADST